MKSVLVLLLLSPFAVYAQHDVMMQGFYWDVPVDDQSKNGSWWVNLQSKSDTLRQAGFTGLWVPPPSKGNFGIYDMGYGIFDLYDLGNYHQKGTVETRFGSRAELEEMIRAMHRNQIAVYADIVMNHLYSSDEQAEENPVVKKYVFDKAIREGHQRNSYPTNEISWVIRNARPGRYLIQVAGYHHDKNVHGGYDLTIGLPGASSPAGWEVEPNNQPGQATVAANGRIASGLLTGNDVDFYSVEVDSTGDFVLRLTAKQKNDRGDWVWADQTNGYYPAKIFYEGRDITFSLQAQTNTSFRFVRHTGEGEKNFQLNYQHFHPGTHDDSLGYYRESEVVSHVKMFGNDLNTFHREIQRRYNEWGKWLVEKVGFDGFRIDWVRGFQPEFLSRWIRRLPLTNEGGNRFVVAEYWGDKKSISEWVATMKKLGTPIRAFDFPLKFALTEMCNKKGDQFDMRTLVNAGLVSYTDKHALSADEVVTFLENHDTGKEHDKWVTRDWRLGYAYLLTHPGRPCVFYNHYFTEVMMDAANHGHRIYPDPALRSELDRLMFIRKTYLGGDISVLSTTRNVYVARRSGNGNKNGCVVMLNNDETSAKAAVDNFAPGEIWVNALDDREEVRADERGSISFTSDARSYKIYVKKNDFQRFQEGK